jgi:hypothetical protein
MELAAVAAVIFLREVLHLEQLVATVETVAAAEALVHLDLTEVLGEMVLFIYITKEKAWQHMQ